MNRAWTLQQVGHMQHAAIDACAFLDGATREGFMEDKRTQQAVIMCLVMVGEIARQVSDKDAVFVKAHPEVPWQSLRDMRHELLDRHFDIDIDAVWQTVHFFLTDLIHTLEKLRREARSLA